MLRKIQGYGWVPDLPDQRARRYAAPRKVLAALPKSCDLRPHCPPVLDQGELGSCTANTIANAHRYDDARQHFIVMHSWSTGWGDKGYCRRAFKTTQLCALNFTQGL